MKKEYLWVSLLVVISFLIRVYRLNTPPSYMFDEVYHAFTAEAYAKNDPRGYEWWHKAPEGFAYEWLHPPLAKLIQAGSIKILGDTAFAWRFPGTVFAAAIVALLYFFGKSLFNPFVGLVAAFLYAFDGLSFVQSRITMNDTYVTFFLVLAFYFFWQHVQGQRRLIWLGLALGLAASTKWTGFYAIPILAGLWLINILRTKNLKPRTLFIGAWSFFIIPSVIYFLSFSQFWLQGHTWSQFKELHNQIWWYQTNLKATHPYQSAAWTWPFLHRPVWYYVNYGENTIANIYAMGNPAIWWAGIVAIGWTMIVLVGRVAEVARQQFLSKSNRSLKEEKLYRGDSLKDSEKIGRAPRDLLALVIIFLGYFGFFLPWVFSPRIMFLYHYLPSIPFMCLALGYGLDRLWQNPKLKILVSCYLLSVILLFLYFYPHLSALAVPKWLSETYFWFPSWR